MRTIRLLASLILMTGPALAGLAACSSRDPASDGVSDGGASDAGTPPSSDAAALPGPDAGDAGALSSTAKVAPVYLGHIVTLDGSESTGPAGFTYEWKITSAPAGSSIASASLTDSTTAKPSFMPDRPGEYVVTLTITAGAAKSSASATAMVVDPPVFYFRSENDAGADYRASLNVVGASTGDGGAVGCFASDAGSYDSLSSSTAKIGTDWWEAPAGEPSRVVFVFDAREDAGSTSVLATTTSAASCATPLTKLDSLSGAPESVRPFEQPRLSPDGERVAYVRSTPAGARIVTTSLAGANRRIIAPLGAAPDGGPDPAAGMPATPSLRPVWTNTTTVAWLQVLDDDHWQIVAAPDVEAATATLVMSCTGSTPSQFDVLPSGEVIVSQNLPTILGQLCVPDQPCGSPAINVVAYPIDPATKKCKPWRNISALPGADGGSFARDFSLSPDRTFVAYQANDDASKKMELMIARVDGTTTPQSVAAPLVGASRGPRWIGNGAFLTWAIAADQVDAGSGSAVAVIAVDGGTGRAIALPPAGGTVEAIGNGTWSCSFGPAAGSGMSLFGAAGLLALRLVRRRRRSRR